LSITEFELVKKRFSVQPFIDGDVDATFLYLSNELFDIQQAGIDYQIVDPGNSASELYDLNLFTSDRGNDELP
jgi:hypothetical protein